MTTREDHSNTLPKNEAFEFQCSLVPQVYMACIMQGRRFGVATFDVDTREMFVLETWEDGSEDFPSMQLIKYQVQPLVIYTTTKMNDTFVVALQKKVTEDAEPYDVKIVKSSVFCYQQARHRLAYLRLSGMKEDFNDRERMHLLNSMMNLDSEMQVRAAGGLLAILQQEMLIDAIDVEEYKTATVQIECISEISLTGFLNVDAVSHDALQIFQVDKHASSMGIGKSKEGFSLFGLLNKCVTLMGRKLLRLWFLRPILDLKTLNDRLNTVSALRCSQELVSALQDTLKRIRDISELITKFSSPSLTMTAKDWTVFTESVSGLIHIRAIFEVAVLQQQQSQVSLLDLQIVKKVAFICNEDLVYVNTLVTGVIDFEQTCGENLETMVAYGVCEELDVLKNIYEGLPDFLDQVATVEFKRLQQHETGSARGVMVYIPQVGYLLRFRHKRLEEDTLERFPDIEFAFEGGMEGGFFYHTSKTRELDEVIGDIFHKILDMEQAILRNLESRLSVFGSTLRQAAKVAAEIDCLISLSIVAHEQKYVRPELTEENILHITNGRHPLQECTVNTFVPNDTDISNLVGRVNVISGPNFSGKSIYAKQVALIVFLAHIGSFVPAEAAEIGLVDRIFTRVASRETMAVPQSSFMIDLHQIAIMLRHATPRSLCVVDEFGKGTLTADGVGLLCATLHQFASRELPPKVLACTHFSEVFDAKYLQKSENIVFHTLSILEPEKSQQTSVSTEDIIFLYRLVPGRAVPSYEMSIISLGHMGVHCAELAGVPPEIVERACEIVENTKAKLPIERLGSQRTAIMDKTFKTIVEELLAFDAEKDNVTTFLDSIFSLFSTC